MKSTTSFFNATLYRKTMARFWPLWGTWALVLAFALPLRFLNEYNNQSAVNLFGVTAALPELLVVFTPILLVGSLLCAMAAFGYLYNSRSAFLYHALPMKRETLFFTEYLAGLSFIVLPLAAVGVLTAAVELAVLPGEYLPLSMKALGAFLAGVLGEGFFFFSFAAFCAMFTGHILALPVFYGVLNGLVFLVYTLVNELMRSFFYGFNDRYFSDNALVNWLTPVYRLPMALRWDMTYRHDPVLDRSIPVAGALYEPSVPLVYAGAAVVFTLLALAVYRRRQVESAGDVVSVALLRPVFRVGVAFCTGLFFGSFTAAFFDWERERLALCVLVVLWTMVGYYAAEMLLRKSFKVFRAWKGPAAIAAAMVLLCACFYFDLWGVEDRIPAPDKVEALSVRLDMGGPDDSAGHLDTRLLEDPELIQVFLDLHASILDHRPKDMHSNIGPWTPGDNYGYLQLTYHLTNGRTLHRRYASLPLQMEDLDVPGTLTYDYAQAAQNRTLLERSYDFASCKSEQLTGVRMVNVYDSQTQDITEAYLDGLTLLQQRQLWQAVQQDFAEGNLGRRWLFPTGERYDNTYYTDLLFFFEQDRPGQEDNGPQHVDLYTLENGETISFSTTRTITLTPQASHTLALLEGFGVLDRYWLVPNLYDTVEGANYVHRLDPYEILQVWPRP